MYVQITKYIIIIRIIVLNALLNYFYNLSQTDKKHITLKIIKILEFHVLSSTKESSQEESFDDKFMFLKYAKGDYVLN